MTARAAVTDAATAPALLSVGYEGRTIDELVEMLQRHHVQVLVDVRLNAISRKPGFSKGRLKAALDNAGITYRHARALGNPKENRAPFHNGEVTHGREVFRALLASDEAGMELGHLVELMRSNRVAVLCFERDHEQCHRHVIATEAGGRSDVDVLHLT